MSDINAQESALHDESDAEYHQNIEKMIRVDHAGEFGAVQIYKGQLDVLRGTKCAEMIEHMYDQEKGHLATFETYMRERGIRPTLLSPVWRIAGYALGAITAQMGEKAAMACTAAVEDVIDKHYGDQLEQLRPEEKDLRAIIEKFRAEEEEHKELALDFGAEQAVGYPVLSKIIKAGSHIAIFLSKRI